MDNKLTRNKNIKKRTKRLVIFKLGILIVNISMLIFLYYLLIAFGANLIIVLLILAFVFLTILSPFAKISQKSYYSKLFPKKNEKNVNAIAQLKELKKQKAVEFSQQKEIPNIKLDFKYRKPFVKKCSKCGIMVPNFVEKCPVCGQLIKS